jgi:hypothetical protein
MMKAMDIPLSGEQEKFQAYLERTYPAVVKKSDVVIEEENSNA